ncbi:NAD-dependent succinate-semialdehyde dehydrogenase [Salinibacterium sp. ZJ450]|uniref:NAD-dependent succinate-semialdehyde dehydrogenase n=1 Tax=Salinibacterium sp. ZJ450 TaxID=2708338 RepID=UPI00141F29AA|nr:NAD-dependent succinate-semialdehyde dehydrogenase [Salinibacterium sp. ZJ450]
MGVRNNQLLIGGEWRDASDGGTFEISNPATETIVATAARATDEDLLAAIECADAAFDGWRRTTGWQRSELLRAAAANIRSERDEIARLLTIEQGKPLAQSLAEVDSCVEQFEWFADEARRIYGRLVDSVVPGVRIQVRREPVGPVAAFTPWNFPIMLAARKLAPALAAGCTIIVKPASEAPSSCLAMVRAIADAGFPSGVIGVVTGQAGHISDVLVGDVRIRKVSLTGSTAVGTSVIKRAADTITNVSMELGGHGPVIIADDVDVAAVAQKCVTTKFRNGGQVCVAPTRFYVHESIVDAFSDAFVEAAGRVVLGDGLDATTDMGPLASGKRIDEVDALVRDAMDDGATRLLGGRRSESHTTGHFYLPTVLRDVPETSRVMQEEPFGPIALINPVADMDEAVRRANSTEFGLAAYAFTTSLDTAQRLSEEIEAGMVGINSLFVSTAVAPFSGVKSSGMGAENGTEAMDAYLTVKTVVTGFES